jgi:hypothetical protein
MVWRQVPGAISTTEALQHVRWTVTTARYVYPALDARARAGTRPAGPAG